jgi:hypothetical protein
MKSLTRTNFRPSRLTALSAALTMAVGATPPPLDAAGQARLVGYRQAPATTGALVYRGTVFSQDRARAGPLFTYERRVAHTADDLEAATHLTQASDGELIIAEVATFATGYALQRFDSTNKQLGHSGSVVLSKGGRHLEYRLLDNGKLSTASEEVDAPVVSGPSLHGFILHHWASLEVGKPLRVRMIVLAKKQTYGFDIRRVESSSAEAGRTSFLITPSSWIVRLALKPLSVTFDSATRNVVRYEGRVPPMQEVEDRLKTLDARVDYTMEMAAYR